MASPSVPLRWLRCRRPSFFMCPITGSMALRRFSSRRMLRVTPELRGILTSGYVSDSAADRLIQTGQVRVVKKPYTAKVLAAELEALGGSLAKIPVASSSSQK